MEHPVMVNILEKMHEVYGKDFVRLEGGKIVVKDDETNEVCEITVRQVQ